MPVGWRGLIYCWATYGRTIMSTGATPRSWRGLAAVLGLVAVVSSLTALQRVSLNGNYQDARMIPVLTSGTATAVWNGFRRIDAA